MTEPSSDKENKATPEQALKASGEQPKKPAKTGAKKSSPKKSRTTKPGEKSGSSGTVLALLALVAALATAGGGYWLWQQFILLQQQQQQTLSQLDSRITTRDETRGGQLTALQQAHEQLGNQLTSRQQKLERSLSGLEGAVQSLHGQLGREAGDWAVAEVEYLLDIANQRLQLNRDSHTALAALEAADKRLNALADPAYLQLREQLVADIQALRAVSRIDRERIALELGGLINGVDNLPLKHIAATTKPASQEENGQTPVAEESTWRMLANTIWSALKDLVVIRHGDTSTRPLLAPEQRQFLRLNLRLKLETARLALLEGDVEVYRGALNESASWLRDYFSPETDTSATFLENVERLAGLDIQPSLPDISGSLRLLHRMQQRNQKSREGNPS